MLKGLLFQFHPHNYKHMLQRKVKAPEYIRAALGKRADSMPTEGLMPDSVINSQKHSLVYLAKGQTAYGPCHLLHPLTTVASIYKGTFLPEHHAIKKNKANRS